MAEPEITEARVRQVARLASLALTDDEVRRMCGDMSAILRYVASLNEVSIEGVEPTFHSLPLTCPLREDRVVPGLTQQQALASAPRSEAGGFAVPKVLDGQG